MPSRVRWNRSAKCRLMATAFGLVLLVAGHLFTFGGAALSAAGLPVSLVLLMVALWFAYMALGPFTAPLADAGIGGRIPSG